MTMIVVEQVAMLLIGFSIGAAILLLVAGLTIYAHVGDGWIARTSGRVLVSGLAILQIVHWLSITGPRNLVGSSPYIVLLFIVAPAFYLFFRGALQVQAAERPWHLAYYAPALLAGWIDPAIAIPLSFLLGTAYATHLGVLVFRLRSQRRRFRIEMLALTVFALIALSILLLGLVSPYYGPRAFLLGYSSMIGLASLLAIHVLLHFPDLASKAAEAVRTAYSVSTLDRIDRQGALRRLAELVEQQVFVDETLKLPGLASMLGLGPHQLSELINTEFGVGYSRYIREHRVAAAQRMLIAEPDASVLSVSMAVGFASQSNFYAAFREITGDVPGRHRSKRSNKIWPSPD